jgi:cytochrome c oxidase subunit 2
MIPGIDNTLDLKVTHPVQMYGQCNNICGQYHAYMRFYVQVLAPDQYQTWYSNQPACSITTAGVPGPPAPGRCTGTNPSSEQNSSSGPNY